MTYVDTAAPTRVWQARGAYLRTAHTGAWWLIDLEPDDWTPAADQVIASRWNTGQDSYAIVLATDGIDFTWVDHEGTQRTHTFTLPSPTGRQTLYLEYVPDNRTVRAFIRAGGGLMRGGFTSMGTLGGDPDDARAFTLRTSTSPLYLATTDADAPDLWSRYAGLIYGFEHRSNDTVVTRWDRTELNATTSTFNDEQAFSWTVNGTADVAEAAGLLTLQPVVDTIAVGRTAPTLIASSFSTWTDTSGTTDVTGNISWLTDDNIVVVGWTEDSTITFGNPTATGLTFGAPKVSYTAGGCNVYIWATDAAANGGPTTVTATASGGAVRGIGAYVYRGSDGVSGVGASRTGTTWVRSLVRAQDKSAVVAVLADWAEIGDLTVTASPTGTVDKSDTVTDRATGFAVSYGDQGTAGTTSYGITGYTATSDFSIAAIEVLGTAGGGGGGPVDYAGAVEAIGELAGALTVDRPLAVAVEAIGETAGVLARERPLASVAEAIGEVAGVLARERPLAGPVEAVAEFTGVLARERPLAGPVEGVVTINGELVRAIDLTAVTQAVGEITGDITIAGQVTYTGTVEAIGELAGVLARTRDLAGASDAIAEIAGAINIAGQVTFTGAVEGVQDTVGALSVAKTYAGAVEAVGDLSGDLSRTRVLAAVLEAVATIIGDLNTGLVVPPSGAPWELTFTSPTQRVTVNDPLQSLVFTSTQQIIVIMDGSKAMALVDNDHRVTFRDPSQTVVL